MLQQLVIYIRLYNRDDYRDKTPMILI